MFRFLYVRYRSRSGQLTAFRVDGYDIVELLRQHIYGRRAVRFIFNVHRVEVRVRRDVLSEHCYHLSERQAASGTPNTVVVVRTLTPVLYSDEVACLAFLERRVDGQDVIYLFRQVLVELPVFF